MAELDHSKKTASCDTTAARDYKQRVDRTDSEPMPKDPGSTNGIRDESIKKDKPKDPVPKLY